MPIPLKETSDVFDKTARIHKYEFLPLPNITADYHINTNTEILLEHVKDMWDDVVGVLRLSGLFKTHRTAGQGRAATGLLTVVHPDSLVNGETFTLFDGVHLPFKTFEYRKSGVPSGTHVGIDISLATTVDDVLKQTINAINGAALLDIDARAMTTINGDDAGDTIFLQNSVAPTTLAEAEAQNLSVYAPIVDTVADERFVHVGMGGAEGPAARGRVTVPAAEEIVEGEQLTIPGYDVNPDVTFTFTYGTPGAGQIGVGNANSVVTDSQLSAAIRTAINTATATTGITAVNSPISARGFITALPKAHLTDGDTFTLSDSVGTKTFEFDLTGAGVTAGNVAIDVHTFSAWDMPSVRAAMISAIGANMTQLNVITDNEGPGFGWGPKIVLRHLSTGVGGNKPVTAIIAEPNTTRFKTQDIQGGAQSIDLQQANNGYEQNKPITTTVVSSKFMVEGMLGGKGAGWDVSDGHCAFSGYDIVLSNIPRVPPSTPGVEKYLKVRVVEERLTLESDPDVTKVTLPGVIQLLSGPNQYRWTASVVDEDVHALPYELSGKEMKVVDGVLCQLSAADGTSIVPTTEVPVRLRKFGVFVEPFDFSLAVMKTGSTMTGKLIINQALTNQEALHGTGNGTGAGLFGTGGATAGEGVLGVGGAGGGVGVRGQGTGTNSVGVQGKGTGTNAAYAGVKGLGSDDGGTAVLGLAADLTTALNGGTGVVGKGGTGDVGGTGGSFTGAAMLSGGGEAGKGLVVLGGTGIEGTTGGTGATITGGDGLDATTGGGLGLGVFGGAATLGDTPGGSGLVVFGGAGHGTGIGGDGVTAFGGTSGGRGIYGIGSTTAVGVEGIGGATNATGVKGTGGGTDGTGVEGHAMGSGSGIRGYLPVGSTGRAVWGDASLSSVGTGVQAYGGSTTGIGLYARTVGSGSAVLARGQGTGLAIEAEAYGSGVSVIQATADTGAAIKALRTGVSTGNALIHGIDDNASAGNLLHLGINIASIQDRVKINGSGQLLLSDIAGSAGNPATTLHIKHSSPTIRLEHPLSSPTAPQSSAAKIELGMNGNQAGQADFILENDQSGKLLSLTRHGAPGLSGSFAVLTAPSSGVVTVTGLTSMTDRHVGETLVFFGSTHPQNNGSREILSYVSPSQVTIRAPDNVVDAGPVQWQVTTAQGMLTVKSNKNEILLVGNTLNPRAAATMFGTARALERTGEGRTQVISGAVLIPTAKNNATYTTQADAWISVTPGSVMKKDGTLLSFDKIKTQILFAVAGPNVNSPNNTRAQPLTGNTGLSPNKVWYAYLLYNPVISLSGDGGDAIVHLGYSNAPPNPDGTHSGTIQSSHEYYAYGNADTVFVGTFCTGDMADGTEHKQQWIFGGSRIIPLGGGLRQVWLPYGTHRAPTKFHSTGHVARNTTSDGYPSQEFYVNLTGSGVGVLTPTAGSALPRTAKKIAVSASWRLRNLGIGLLNVYVMQLSYANFASSGMNGSDALGVGVPSKFRAYLGASGYEEPGPILSFGQVPRERKFYSVLDGGGRSLNGVLDLDGSYAGVEHHTSGSAFTEMPCLYSDSPTPQDAASLEPMGVSFIVENPSAAHGPNTGPTVYAVNSDTEAGPDGKGTISTGPNTGYGGSERDPTKGSLNNSSEYVLDYYVTILSYTEDVNDTRVYNVIEP